MKYLLPMIILSSILSTISAQSLVSESQESLKRCVSNNRTAGISGGYATSDEILWIGYEGYADLKAKKPVDSLTYFRTASIAKPITAIAIMQLVEKDKLDLDRPISEYIPDFPIKDGESITVRHLLHHTSGIGAYKSPKESETKKEYPTLRDAMKVFETRELRFPPGSNYAYTSYGYVVLGWVIEKISGLTYEAYIKENIFAPAGMHHTGVEKYCEPPQNQTKFYTQKNRNHKRYRSEDNKVKEKKRTNLSNRTPGGGLYTTVEDLLKFGQAILKHQLISEQSLNLMWTDSGLKKEGNPYGMGWFLYGESARFGNVYGHGGGQSGASNQLMIMPKVDLVTVIMSNTSHTWGHVFGMILNYPEDALGGGGR